MEEEPQPERPAPAKSDETWLGSFARVAPLFLALTAIGSGLAFFLGWRYEKAYIEEWGLEFSAFSYSPYELMVASSTTLIWAVTTPLAFLMGELLRPIFSLDTFFGLPPAGVRRSAKSMDFAITFVSTIFFVGGAVAVALIIILSDDVKFAMTVAWIALLLIGGFSWQYARAGSANARWIVLLVGVLALVFILLGAPAGLGREDARDDRKQIERLPRVEIVLHESLGLELERVQGEQVRTGPWRLIRVNEGHLWLAPDVNEPTEVIQIASSDVASVTYLSGE